MAGKKKARYVALILLTLLLLTPPVFRRVDAMPSQLKQSIVPLECYIDAVNSGNGSHLYITPEDCLDDKAADTINEAVVPSPLISKLKEYGQEIPAQQTDQQIDAGPKSREFEPKKGSNRFAVFDNLRTDNFVSLLLVISLVVPISAGLYLLLRSKRSTLE